MSFYGTEEQKSGRVCRILKSSVCCGFRRCRMEWEFGQIRILEKAVGNRDIQVLLNQRRAFFVCHRKGCNSEDI